MSVSEPSAVPAVWRLDARSLEDVPLPAMLVDEVSQSILEANALALSLFARSRDELRRLHLEELSIAAAAGPAGAVFRCAVVMGDRPAQLVVVHDIAAACAAQKGLRASEARYRRLFDSSHELVHSLDTSGRFLYANAAWLEALGLTEEAFSCMTMADVVAPESFDDYLDAVASAVCGRQVDHLEIAFRTRDRRTVLTEGCLTPLPSIDRDSMEVVGLFHDVTARRRAEQSVRDAQARLESLIENANDVVYCTDLHGRITYVNPAASRLTGFDRSRLVGMVYTEVIHRDYREQAWALYERQFVERLPNTYFEFPILTASGAEVWIGQNVQLIYEQGQVIGFQGVARDVTAQRRAGEELALATDSLRANARTRVDVVTSVSAAIDVRLGRARTAFAGVMSAREGDRAAALKAALDDVTLSHAMISDMLDFFRHAEEGGQMIEETAEEIAAYGR